MRVNTPSPRPEPAPEDDKQPRNQTTKIVRLRSLVSSLFKFCPLPLHVRTSSRRNFSASFPKRQRTGALQDAARGSGASGQRASVLDCGGPPPLFITPTKPFTARRRKGKIVSPRPASCCRSADCSRLKTGCQRWCPQPHRQHQPAPSRSPTGAPHRPVCV
jgi:hypothetical protein